MNQNVDGTFGKAINLLKDPKGTFEAVSGEKPSMQEIVIYTALVAIPTLIGLIVGFGVVGVGSFGYRYRVPFAWALSGGIVQYVFAIVGVVITGYVINLLANSFSSSNDLSQAMKIAAYGATPSLIAGILYIFPPLSFVVFLVGLYGWYIIYLGLPTIMGTPEDKRVTYFIAIIVVNLIVSAVVSQIGTLII